MSFDRQALNPSLDTHVPLKIHVPKESDALAVGRPDIPAPSIWQKSVKVVRKLDGLEAVVNTLDLTTMMFRAYYPDEGERDEDGKPAGRFADRTEWEHCRDWNVAVTFSPRELERRAAKQLLDEEIMKLNPKELAAVSILCDDPDPAKGLAKLEALRALGIISSVDVTSAAIAETKTADTAKKGGK